MRVWGGLFRKCFIVLLSFTTLILLYQTFGWLRQLKRGAVSVHQKKGYDNNDARNTKSHTSRTSGLRNGTPADSNNSDENNVSSTSSSVIALIPKTKASTSQPINFKINDASGKNVTLTVHQPFLNYTKLASLSEQANITNDDNNNSNSNMPDNNENNVTSTSNSVIALIPNTKANNTSQSNNFGINDALDDNMTLTIHQPPIVDAIELHSLSKEAKGTYYYLAQNNTKRTDIHDWSNNDTPSNNMNKDESSSNSSRPLPLCAREEIRLGEWVPLAMPEAPYVPKNVVCLPAEAYTSGPWNTWEWQPFAAKAGKCALSKWNATQFCSLVQHATVAIVGDSLSWEQYASLAQLLGQPVTEELQYQSRRKGYFVSHLVCHNQTRLVYLRDDDLKRVDLVLNTSSPNILILNRGAHFAPDSTLEAELQSIVVPQVQAWQESCQKSQRPCRLFVRTSVPGHPSCTNFTEPVQSAQEMEMRIANISYYILHQRNYHWSYHWEDFQRQNHLSLRVYQEANLTFDVLDGYDINILRPDDHSKPVNNEDCLHSCFPGKMDTYNQLLLHFLQRSGGVAMNGSATDSWRFLNQSNVVS